MDGSMYYSQIQHYQDRDRYNDNRDCGRDGTYTSGYNRYREAYYYPQGDSYVGRYQQAYESNFRYHPQPRYGSRGYQEFAVRRDSRPRRRSRSRSRRRRDRRSDGGGGGGSRRSSGRRRDRRRSPSRSRSRSRRRGGGGGGGDRERRRRRRRRRDDRRRDRRGGGGGERGTAPLTDGESSEESDAGSSGRDDSEHHHPAPKGATLNGRYVIEKQVGLGTFGKVVRCLDSLSGDGRRAQAVAVKIVRRVRRYRDSAKIEADLLYDVNAHARGRALCSQILAHFDEQGHYCLVLEELGRSLYDYLKGNAYAGFPPGHLRAFGRQLLECLAFLKDIKLIHTDLKPENVLVCPGRDVEAAGPGGRRILVPAEPRIKVIDFGGATYDDEHKSSIINTRQYRGPEVTLGLGWSFPSDQWSVGCILAELFSGELFFGTHANNEHLALMEKSLGPFPETVWCNASKEGAKYFDSQGRVRTDEFGKANRRRVAEQLPVAAFAAEGPAGLGPLLAGLLALDPARRLTPEAALAHAFFAGEEEAAGHSDAGEGEGEGEAAGGGGGRAGGSGSGGGGGAGGSGSTFRGGGSSGGGHRSGSVSGSAGWWERPCGGGPV